MVREIYDSNHLDEILASHKAILLYFYNNHCAPCISLRPKVTELVGENFPRMEVLMINAIDHPDITARHSVFSYPVLLLYFDHKEFRRYTNYVSIKQLKDTIGKYYDLLYG